MYLHLRTKWRTLYLLYVVRRLVHSNIVTTSASILQNVKLLPTKHPTRLVGDTLCPSDIFVDGLYLICDTLLQNDSFFDCIYLMCDPLQ